MEKGLLESFSKWAKENLEKQIEVSLKSLGINGDNNFATAKKVGDYTVIDGDPTSYPASLFDKRKEITKLIENQGYKNVIEEFAYTWFNRLVALRFMEVHDYLSHGFRVLSSRDGGIEPEILKNLGFVKDDLKLDVELCANLREQGKIEELFRYVLFSQCNALADILPMLFDKEHSYLELLLPKNLLKGETVITRMLEIPEEDFLNEIEIIGWLYQFYNAAKKKAVNDSKKTITKDTLPAVTQLFTPDWIVRYMAENSVGRVWLESYPNSSLRGEMKYYVDDPEQTEEVQRKLDAIKYKNVNPEEIKIIEPCCGSGHILVYVFDLLYKMYEEKGYQKRDIPTLILSNNLTGLDVDKRASQLASFSLIMKAREMNNRFFTETYYVVPHVYEIKDSTSLIHMGYKKQIEDMGLLNDTEREAIDYLVEAFIYGKTIGSLLRITKDGFLLAKKAIENIENNGVSNIFNMEFMNSGLSLLKYLWTLAEVLSETYDVMITNPPYIGISAMESLVKDYATRNYPNSKTDMFTMFMETGFVKPNGFTAMINMHSWMYLDSYKKLRIALINSCSIINMAHIGPRGFDAIPGEVVQTTAFIIRSAKLTGLYAFYYRLLSAQTEKGKEQLFLCGNEKYKSTQEKYIEIPGCPISYRASEKAMFCYNNYPTVNDVSYVKKGMFTGCNDQFFRMWYEPNFHAISFNISNHIDIPIGHYVPMNSGGAFRRWYGNRMNIIKFDLPHYSLIGKNNGHRSPQLYFHKTAAWTKITTGKFSIRFSEEGFINNDASMAVYENDVAIERLIAFLNGKVAQYFLGLVNESLNYTSGNVASIPYIDSNDVRIISLESSCVNISKIDWDSYETSWDFSKHPLIELTEDGSNDAKNMSIMHSAAKEDKLDFLIENSYSLWAARCLERFTSLKSNEEKLNQIFIDIYGLQGELNPEVDDKDVSVSLADKERDVKSLISYFIGIIMGRYSLDFSGLAYAGGAWDETKYQSYKPDDDGIVPIYNKIGMSDGLTGRIIELIKLIYGDDTYRQNIDFVAEALGKKSSESSEETLNRYLNEGFYSDHLKVYQKRPIYWMFSSGKNSGFKCLIYMHRYKSDTLAAINGKYFLPESTRLKNELDELNVSISTAEGRDKIKLENERQKIAAAYNEAIEYGQVLDHMANKFIDIDLDDGVKVNYAKFQNVELVTDSGTKVKKDLLVPIK